MISSSKTCACAVTAAPLNPAYREDEFHFYMDDLKARALLVEEGSTSPAIAAAMARRPYLSTEGGGAVGRGLG